MDVGEYVGILKRFVRYLVVLKSPTIQENRTKLREMATTIRKIMGHVLCVVVAYEDATLRNTAIDKFVGLAVSGLAAVYEMLYGRGIEDVACNIHDITSNIFDLEEMWGALHDNSQCPAVFIPLIRAHQMHAIEGIVGRAEAITKHVVLWGAVLTQLGLDCTDPDDTVYIGDEYVIDKDVGELLGGLLESAMRGCDWEYLRQSVTADSLRARAPFATSSLYQATGAYPLGKYATKNPQPIDIIKWPTIHRTADRDYCVLQRHTKDIDMFLSTPAQATKDIGWEDAIATISRRESLRVHNKNSGTVFTSIISSIVSTREDASEKSTKVPRVLNMQKMGAHQPMTLGRQVVNNRSIDGAVLVESDRVTGADVFENVSDEDLCYMSGYTRLHDDLWMMHIFFTLLTSKEPAHPVTDHLFVGGSISMSNDRFVAALGRGVLFWTIGKVLYLTIDAQCCVVDDIAGSLLVWADHVFGKERAADAVVSVIKDLETAVERSGLAKRSRHELVSNIEKETGNKTRETKRHITSAELSRAMRAFE